VDSHIAAAVGRCREALASAADNAGAGRWHRCASDLYFAVFYAADAALARKGISTNKHSQTQSEFNRVFVKGGAIDVTAGRVYNQLFELRLRVDYEMSVSAEEADVRPLIDPAEALIEDLLTVAQAEVP
jgi:uncharacterized protein (UPF0332 family)